MGDQLRLRAPDHSGAESAAQIAELEGFAARVVCRKAGTRQSMAAKLAGRTRAAGADLPVRADCVLDRVSLRMDRETGSQPAIEDVAAFRGAQKASPALASRLYLELLRQLERRGFRRKESQTPFEFAAAVSEPALAPAVREFTLLYADARFGGAPCNLPRLRELLLQIRSGSRPF